MAIMPAKSATGAHTAGIFADMTLDGLEIGTLVAVIDRARNLPNRKTMGKQDPYCAMRLGKEAKKTETDRRGGQTPRWDQELRFTVHESPDYYKLKCSVFNDDKKTDLIGESWVDLREVVIPGGGQNDLWHQLQFKGKYAGEIRMELTYYDTRPKDEAVIEKRREKQRNNSQSTAGGEAGGPRQLGPREIRRRPLPPSPAASPPHQASLKPSPNLASQQSQVNDLTPPPQQHQQDCEQFPAYDDSRSTYPHRSFVDSPRFQDVGEESWCSDWENPDSIHNAQESVYGCEIFTEPAFETSAAPVSELSSTSMDQYGWTGEQRTRLSPNNSAYLPTGIPASSSRRSSPNGIQSSPQTMDQRQTSTFNRYSTSPIKNAPFRDSPLRQSINRHDLMDDFNVRPQTAETEDVVPPPPPVHRAVSYRADFPDRMYESIVHYEATNSSNVLSPRSPLDVRHTLHAIESNYALYQSSPSSVSPSSSRQQSYETRASYIPNVPQEQFRHSTGSFPAAGHGVIALAQRSGSCDDMRRYDEPANLDHHAERRSNSQYYQQMQSSPLQRQQLPVRSSYGDDHSIYNSSPPLFRPRAVSPNSRSEASRRSLSPAPEASSARDQLDSVPFGPEAYEAINPVQGSPAITQPTSPSDIARTLEEQRLREVEKLRDLGPIIGNDGREIDPSDHLPSDTWAPEPHRKQRKPEVIIRMKTRDQTQQTSLNGNSAPVSVRPLSYFQLSLGSSACSTGPDLHTAKTSRNRLQKQAPSRPLPVQPYQHAHSSPAVPQQHTTTRPPPSQALQHAHSNPSIAIAHHAQGYSTPSSRTSMSARPAVSEYNVNSGDVYNNSSRSFPYGTQLPLVPAKVPLNGRDQCGDFSRSGSVDSLSAEMSTIDIGPIRGGRMGLRSNRGYGH